MTRIRIGTRGSALALWQARHVASRLRLAAPQVAVELVEIVSAGDALPDVPLAGVEGTGFFTATLQRALLRDEVDVAAGVKSKIEPGTPGKYLDFPKSRYGLFQMDEVRKDGRLVGISTDCGYVTNEQLYMSLATVDVELADGDEVVVIWGEDPISRKHSVDRIHRQMEIRATVAPAPYQEYARTVYRAD